MSGAGGISERRGHDVTGSDGHKTGTLEPVRRHEPASGTVTAGLAARHRLVFVPLAGAIASPGYLKVTYARRQVKDAPSTGTDGALPAGDEEAIFKHYDLAGAANKATAIAQRVIGHRPPRARRGGLVIRRGVRHHSLRPECLPARVSPPSQAHTRRDGNNWTPKTQRPAGEWVSFFEDREPLVTPRRALGFPPAP